MQAFFANFRKNVRFLLQTPAENAAGLPVGPSLRPCSVQPPPLAAAKAWRNDNLGALRVA